MPESGSTIGGRGRRGLVRHSLASFQSSGMIDLTYQNSHAN